MKRLLIHSTNNILVQFFRYLFVGGFAFLVDFGTFTFLTTYFDFFKSYYLFANILSFILGLTTNYFLSVRWVFNKRTIENRWVEFALFAVVGLIGLGLNSFIIWLFKEHILTGFAAMPDNINIGNKVMDLKIILSKLIATAVVYIWNFSARKFTLFK